MFVLRARVLVASAVLSAVPFGVVACGTEAASPSDNGGSGGGGTLGAEDAKITGTVTQCPGTTPQPLPNEMVASCTLEGCSAAACIPSNLIQQFVSPETDLTPLGTCGDPSVYCVPIDYIATTGQFLFKSCTSLGGAEGRCVSTCIPLVAERMTQLPQADCHPTERCAPCYDPITGDVTPACSQACDTGPTQPPFVFAECGAGLGLCVPQDLVPPDLRSAVPVADCTTAGFVCAPKTHVDDINYVFPTCTPSSDLIAAVNPMPGPNGQVGGCVPAYLVEHTEPAPPDGAVLQDGCAAGHLCAPCYNPLVTPQTPTGACPLQ
jgi:hypothetical protein